MDFIHFSSDGFFRFRSIDINFTVGGIACATDIHGLNDRLKTFSENSEMIFDFWRNFRIDALDQLVGF